jgi:hypothetical protein
MIVDPHGCEMRFSSVRPEFERLVKRFIGQTKATRSMIETGEIQLLVSKSELAIG